MRYSKDRFDEILEISSTAGDRPPWVVSIYFIYRKAIVGCVVAMFRLLGAFTLILVLAGIDVRPVSAAESRLPEFLKKFEPEQIFPGANRYGPVEGSPPAAAAFGGDRLLGYVYLNADVVNSTGYSGKPINIVVGIDLNGKIVGLQLAEHHEPIVLVGIPPAKITAFLEGYIGRNFLETPTVNNEAAPVDIISGATVTVMVIADSLTRSAIRIARSRGLGTALAALAPAAPAAVKKINDAHNQPEDWNALLTDGSIGRMPITIGEINDAFAKSGNAAAAEQPEGGPASDSFIDLYAALATVPSIGRSLLGDVGYNQLKQRLKPGQQAIIVAGKGRYSFKGSGYVRGGISTGFNWSRARIASASMTTIMCGSVISWRRARRNFPRFLFLPFRRPRASIPQRPGASNFSYKGLLGAGTRRF